MICYVLNLERHQARLQSFLQQFDSSDLTASELRRFRAVDAASVWPHARALVYQPAQVSRPNSAATTTGVSTS